MKPRRTYFAELRPLGSALDHLIESTRRVSGEPPKDLRSIDAWAERIERHNAKLARRAKRAGHT